VLVGLCQQNPTVGALEANSDSIIEGYRAAASLGARIAVFGELAVSGYPPEDLVLRRQFLVDCRAQLDRIAAATGGCAAVVGFPELGDDGHRYNSAAVCRNGRVELVYRKQHLPTYDVFDEERCFEPGAPDQPLYELDGVRIGVSICEDIWMADGPVARQAAAGAQLLVVVNGSPFHQGRLVEREAMLLQRASEARVPVVYVNQVGGQDDLVFDGGSMVVGPDGVRHRTVQFAESLTVIDTDLAGEVEPPLDPWAETWSALVLGTRDYARKNGFTDAVLGLSGGVDSALVAVIAADALGPEHVHAVLMPSRYSSGHSVDDAEELCRRVGIDCRTIAIEAAHSAFLDLLMPSLAQHRDAGGGPAPGGQDLTDENLQARVRGVLLMALSNEFGWLVVATGNKSEAAVGYSTLYGDTVGGLAVIKDVFKTGVYELCDWRNAQGDGELIPEHILTKAPSAELRPGQTDQQSLPPYDVLDRILSGYVDGDATPSELVEAGFDHDVVQRICTLVDHAEYKRRQTPPGLRVMRKAFGRDRRVPITNRYR